MLSGICRRQRAPDARRAHLLVQLKDLLDAEPAERGADRVGREPKDFMASARTENTTRITHSAAPPAGYLQGCSDIKGLDAPRRTGVLVIERCGEHERLAAEVRLEVDRAAREDGRGERWNLVDDEARAVLDEVAHVQRAVEHEQELCRASGHARSGRTPLTSGARVGVRRVD